MVLEDSGDRVNSAGMKILLALGGIFGGILAMWNLYMEFVMIHIRGRTISRPTSARLLSVIFDLVMLCAVLAIGLVDWKSHRDHISRLRRLVFVLFMSAALTDVAQWISYFHAGSRTMAA